MGIMFRNLMCLQNTKTGQIAYMAHPTDCSFLGNSMVSGDYHFDECAEIDLMKDHKMHKVKAYRKGHDWFMPENKFINL